MNGIDITDILVAILTIIFAVITRFVIPWIKTKVTNEQLSTITTWVKIAVQAAEILYNESGKGKEKKEYVLKFLNEKGFSVNADEIDNLVESAVLELKNEIKGE